MVDFLTRALLVIAIPFLISLLKPGAILASIHVIAAIHLAHQSPYDLCHHVEHRERAYPEHDFVPESQMVILIPSPAIPGIPVKKVLFGAVTLMSHEILLTFIFQRMLIVNGVKPKVNRK